MTGVFTRRGTFEHRHTGDGIGGRGRDWSDTSVSQGISVMDDFHQKLGIGKEAFCPTGSNGGMVLLKEISDLELPEL